MNFYYPHASTFLVDRQQYSSIFPATHTVPYNIGMALKLEFDGKLKSFNPAASGVSSCGPGINKNTAINRTAISKNNSQFI